VICHRRCEVCGHEKVVVRGESSYRCACGALVVPSPVEMAPRGTSLVGRSLDVVTGALDTVRKAALDRALDPRNCAKGHWRDLTRTDLCALLLEEVAEMLTAVEQEPWDRVLAEAGDVVWVVAMIVDWHRGRDG
jgi:hypothetical protein